MTDRNIRHLPVLKDNKLVGIISIGDIVKAVMNEQATTIRHLSDYIDGKYMES
jgi:CBS domain-containing protein